VARTGSEAVVLRGPARSGKWARGWPGKVAAYEVPGADNDAQAPLAHLETHGYAEGRSGEEKTEAGERDKQQQQRRSESTSSGAAGRCRAAGAVPGFIAPHAT
jgi:hypothetical protein